MSEKQEQIHTFYATMIYIIKAIIQGKIKNGREINDNSNTTYSLVYN